MPLVYHWEMDQILYFCVLEWGANSFFWVAICLKQATVHFTRLWFLFFCGVYIPSTAWGSLLAMLGRPCSSWDLLNLDLNLCMQNLCLTLWAHILHAKKPLTFPLLPPRSYLKIRLLYFPLISSHCPWHLVALCPRSHTVALGILGICCVELELCLRAGSDL